MKVDWAEANRELFDLGLWKTTFAGRRLCKYPWDLEVYRSLIQDSGADVLVETGSDQGGSAAWFAQYVPVVSVDLYPPDAEIPGVTWVRGDSVQVAERVLDLVGDRSCLVSLDSDHNAEHVLAEMEAYSKIATRYMVVEDTGVDRYGLDDGVYPGGGPGRAVDWFLLEHPEWSHAPEAERYPISANPGGWLRR